MNKAYLIGNLTRDPENRTTQSGVSVCNFSIAVNRRMKSDGQQETDFFNIVAWRSLGDLCAKYLSKGKKCAVFGRIETRTYEAQDGSKRTAFEIVADEVEFLSPAGQGTNQARNAAPAEGAYTTAVSKKPDNPQEGFTQVDSEELPF